MGAMAAGETNPNEWEWGGRVWENQLSREGQPDTDREVHRAGSRKEPDFTVAGSGLTPIWVNAG